MGLREWFRKLFRRPPPPEPEPLFYTPAELPALEEVEPKPEPVPVPMDALAQVQPEEGPRPDESERLAVSADTLYPTALEYIADMLADRQSIPAHLSNEMMMARRLPEAAWVHAWMHKRECPSELYAMRSAALEHARRVFTADLRAQCGKPIVLHILRGETDKWKL